MHTLKKVSLLLLILLRPSLVQALPSQIPADVSFMCVDLKYSTTNDTHTIKILEFGDGRNAGYRILGKIYSDMGRAWRSVWNYLNQFNLPIFFVGRFEHNLQFLAWNTFVTNKGYQANNFTRLEQHPVFTQLARENAPAKKTSLDQHCGIIISRQCKGMDRFREKYPQFLMVNTIAKKYTRKLHLNKTFFTTPELLQFRPYSQVYPKVYSNNLIKQIENDFKDYKKIVIKPMRSSKGNGVLVIKKNKVKEVLNLILKKFNNNKPFNDNFIFQPSPPLSFNYWKFDRNSKFIVESFEESSYITVNNKEYDATMRVIFTLEYNEGIPSVTFIDAYWKRPVSSVTDKSSFQKKHISNHPSKQVNLGAKVQESDLRNVYELLRPVLTNVYLNMLNDFYGPDEKGSHE